MQPPTKTRLLRRRLLASRLLAFVSAACLLAAPSRADESGEEPVRAIVRVVTPTDRDLLRRARGQTNDLSLEIIEVDHEALEPKLSGQMAAADQEAAKYDARAVVWFESDQDETLLVHILVAATGRVLVRRVVASPPSSRSAMLEGAALIVRSAFRAIAAGATIGVTRQEAMVADGPPSAPKIRDTPSPPNPPPPQAEKIRSLLWVPLLGGDLSYNGATVQKAAVVGFAMENRRFELGAALRIGAPSEYVEPFATVELLRHTGVLTVGIPLHLSPHIKVCACLEGGITSIRRATVSTTSSAIPAPSNWTVSPVVGPELKLTWRAPIGGGWELGTSLTGGADVITNAPKLGYGVGAAHEFVTTRQLWSVQPRGQLALEVAIP